jgi:hypothetical protein
LNKGSIVFSPLAKAFCILHVTDENTQEFLTLSEVTDLKLRLRLPLAAHCARWHEPQAIRKRSGIGRGHGGRTHGRRVELSIECHQVSRQAAFEGLSFPHQLYSPFLGVAGQ